MAISIEVKKESSGRDDYKQVKRYTEALGSILKKPVKGILVCSGILPTFTDLFDKRATRHDIEVYTYGWKFNLNKLEEA